MSVKKWSPLKLGLGAVLAVASLTASNANAEISKEAAAFTVQANKFQFSCIGEDIP